MQKQRFLIPRVLTHIVVVEAERKTQAIQLAYQIPAEQWPCLPDDMQGMDSVQVIDLITPDQPHIQVIYDLTYYGTGDANYADRTPCPTTQYAYIPSKLITTFQSLHQAFECYTQVGSIHLADYDEQSVYTHDGQLLPETSETNTLLADLDNYFTC